MEQTQHSPEREKPVREGVAVLATYGGGLLLGRRLKEPNYGKWVLPGGGMKPGETKQRTAVRELFEEANINIERVEEFTVMNVEEPDMVRRIYTVKAHIIDPFTMQGGSDLGEPRLFTREEIAELEDISDVVRPVLKDAGWLD